MFILDSRFRFNNNELCQFIFLKLLKGEWYPFPGVFNYYFFILFSSQQILRLKKRLSWFTLCLLYPSEVGTAMNQIIKTKFHNYFFLPLWLSPRFFTAKNEYVHLYFDRCMCNCTVYVLKSNVIARWYSLDSTRIFFFFFKQLLSPSPDILRGNKISTGKFRNIWICFL